MKTNSQTCGIKRGLKNILSDVVLVSGAIFTLSVISLAAALTAEHLYGLAPCILCIYQRIPYLIAALLATASLIIAFRAERAKIAAFTIFLCTPVFLIGAGIAFYHVGVEQHWWVSHLEGCAVEFAAASPEDLMALIDAAPAARCDEIAWADPFFGISMAGYNIAYSLGLAAFSALGALFITRKTNGL